MSGGNILFEDRKTKNYIKEEDAFIRKHFATKSGDWIAENLNRTRSSVYCRASKLGISKCKKWTKKEKGILKRCYKFFTAKELQKKLPGHTISSIRSQANSLGYKSGVYWSNKQKKYLLENYETKPIKDLRKEFLIDKTPAGIHHMAGKLNLKSSVRLSSYEENYIKANFGKELIVNIVKKLGRSCNTIVKCAKRLGVYSIKKFTSFENFFDEPGVLNSYWAGFINARGRLINTDKKRYAIHINGPARLLDQLELFQKHAQSDYKIHRVKKSFMKSEKKTYNYQLQITNKKWFFWI